jgi:branched-chain amino acid transport system permease protein
MAHGVLMTVGAYVVYLATTIGMSPFTGFVIATAVVAAFAMLLYDQLVKPIEESPFRYIIALMILSFILQEVFSLGITSGSRSVPFLVEGFISVSGVRITWNRLLAFGVSWLLLGAVWYFTTKMKLGQSIRAMSMDEKGAAAIGINLRNAKLIVWGMSGAMAAIAGYFYGSLTTVSPQMGFDPLLLGLVIIVVGGMGSIGGALVTSYLIGIVETAATLLIDPTLQGIVSLIIVLVVLLVRPEGIFGGREIDMGV